MTTRICVIYCVFKLPHTILNNTHATLINISAEFELHGYYKLGNLIPDFQQSHGCRG